MKLTLKKCFVSTFILIHFHNAFAGKEIARKYILFLSFFAASLKKLPIDFYKLFQEFHSWFNTKFCGLDSRPGTEERAFRFPRFISPEFIFDISNETNRKIYFVNVPVIK